VAARKLPVVLRHRVPIPGRDVRRVGVADRAAPVLIELPAQFQLQRIHAADKLLVHLFHQRRVPWEALRIQIAHLVDQRLQLLPRFRAILHRRANLVEKVQSLVDLPLRIGRICALLRRHGLARDVRIARIPRAKPIAIPVAPAARRRIANRSCVAVSNRAGLAVAHPASLLPAALACLLLPASALTALAALTTLLSRLTLLSGLAGLPVLPLALTLLPRLPVAIELARLKLLAAGWSATAGLSLAGLPVGGRPKTRELVAQTR